eukprot:snap_masked-scaffold_15-processed-gene-1.24-mRNA-1 protein AED:0.06 eAED:0.06 QI:0/-1/0/1/-1/1/1/0/230
MLQNNCYTNLFNSSQTNNSRLSNITVKCVEEEKKGSSQKWEPVEDELLKQLVDKYGVPNWVLIASQIPGKSASQSMQRWQQVLRPGIKKGSWTVAEDNKLRDLIYRKHGSKVGEIRSWKFVEKHMNGRTAKQCRERWILSLDPTINRSEWEEEEDNKLLSLQRQYGNKWSLIKTLLDTNRTQNAVKLRFKKLRKRDSDDSINLFFQEHQNAKRVRMMREDFLEISDLLSF